MDVILKSRNGKVSERQRTYIQEKIGKLTRYADQIQSAKVEVATEQRENQGEIHRVQVTLVGEHGIILRADQHAPDIFAATDQAQNVLKRQIERFKEKHWRRGRLRRKGDEFIEVDPAVVEGDTTPEPPMSAADETQRRITRMKKFALKPMFSDEAVEQMELLGHNFFVFRDADTSQFSVVYRRNDGNYGLIVPDDRA
jgi:ribosomal subunit interface protein